MHCLNLKLTYDCTNRCSFCFSSYLKKEKIEIDGLLCAVEEGWRRGCNELVLSGGEPTLCPDVLIKVMTLASQLGYKKYIIQTNGSGIIDHAELLPFLRRLGETVEICLSFSVHGHTARVHDEMSQREGAFEKLLQAMHLIHGETGCGIYTNTVISRLNISNLREIVTLLRPFAPQIIQFSMMHLAEPTKLSTGLLESAEAVRELAEYVDSAVLKTEGIPYCLLYGLEHCVGESYWPNTLDLYNRNANYLPDFRQLDTGMRWKRNDCVECLMNSICMGIWKEHAQEFARAPIHPIR